MLLGSGRGRSPTIEALDRTGLWGRLLPEWGAVRDLPPRDAVHTWTVDRHLVETAAHASAFTTRVARPDLLVLGALLHDIGKGRGGDHSVVGAELATQIGNRLGLWPSDVALLTAMVRHHLLLPRDGDPPRPRRPGDRAEGRRHPRRRPGAARAARTRSPRPTRWPPDRVCGATGSRR